jgi:hypothetical protein
VFPAKIADVRRGTDVAIKTRVPWLAIAATCLVFATASCSGTSATTEMPSEPPAAATSPEDPRAITSADLTEAHDLVVRHVRALAARDLSAWTATLTKARGTLSAKERTAWPKEAAKWRDVAVSTTARPGKFVTDEMATQTYVDKGAASPYKLLVLATRFELPQTVDGTVPHEWDYVLVKEGPSASWLISDWGY